MFLFAYAVIQSYAVPLKPLAPLRPRDQELDQGLRTVLNQRKPLNSDFQLIFSEVGFLATLTLWVAKNKLAFKVCGNLGEVSFPPGLLKIPF